MEEALRKKIDRDLIRGKKKEYAFKDSAENSNIKCEVIEDDRDWSDHLDVIMHRSPDINEWKVDVKSEKKDVAVIDGTWLELQNVKGRFGWLYAPDLRAIVFEIKEEFWVVDLYKLRKIVQDNLKEDDGNYYSKQYMIDNEMYYYPYKRRGRDDEDIIIITPLAHIEPLCLMKIPVLVNEEVSNI